MQAAAQQSHTSGALTALACGPPPFSYLRLLLPWGGIPTLALGGCSTGGAVKPLAVGHARGRRDGPAPAARLPSRRPLLPLLLRRPARNVRFAKGGIKRYGMI
jgi:hypothetical protein